MSDSPTRRQFLASVIALGAGGGLVLVLQPVGCGRGSATTIDLSDVFGDTTTAAELGRAYLARYPAETDRQALEAHVLGPTGGEPPDPRTRLRERIRQDFTHGRLFRHRGWLLSRTEARLCALASLTFSGAIPRGSRP